MLIVSYNIPTNWKVKEFTAYQEDYLESNHIKIGKILGNYEELNKNFIATVVDAGAMPYYSKWKAYDYVLNDKYVIQHGFDADRFYSFEPKLIIFDSSFGGLADIASAELEKEYLLYLQKPQKGPTYEITVHPEFKNYKLLTFFSKQTIFVEKEFAEENPELMNDLINASKSTRGTV